MSPKVKKIVKLSLLYGLIALVVGIVAYFAVIRPLQVRQEKARFEKAAVELEKVRTEIEAKIGKADEVKQSKTCDRAHLKNARGPLACSVELTLVYGHKDAPSSTTLMQQASQLGTSAIRIGSLAAEGSSFKSRDKAKTVQAFYQDYESLAKLHCTLGYKYPSDTNEEALLQNLEEFVLVATCGNPAKAEHYPLQN